MASKFAKALPGSRRYRKRQIVSVLRLAEQPDRLSHLYRLLKRMNPSLAQKGKSHPKCLL